MKYLRTVFNSDGFPAYSVGYAEVDEVVQRSAPLSVVVDARSFLGFWEVIERDWLALWELYA
jgi:hypothetical protein